MTTYNLRREYVINRLRSYEERLGIAPLTPERSLFLALLVAAYAAGAGKIKSSQVRRWVEDVLRAIASLREPDGRGGWEWVMRWSLAEATGMHEKVCLAKINALLRKKLIAGCGCGCRGDIELTAEGERMIAERSELQETK